MQLITPKLKFIKYDEGIFQENKYFNITCHSLDLNDDELPTVYKIKVSCNDQYMSVINDLKKIEKNTVCQFEVNVTSYQNKTNLRLTNWWQ